MKKKILVIMVIFMVSALMVSCNSCMRSSAEPTSQLQEYAHLDSAMKASTDTGFTDKSPKTTQTDIKQTAPDSLQNIAKQSKSSSIQNDSLYNKLRKNEEVLILQQKQIDSLLMNMKKKK